MKEQQDRHDFTVRHFPGAITALSTFFLSGTQVNKVDLP